MSVNISDNVRAHDITWYWKIFNLFCIEGKPHNISFPDGNNLTVGDLRSLVESKFNIRRNAQKLIFSGKSLDEESANLASYNIKSGSKIMLIGRIEKTDPLELQKLSDLEEIVPSLCSQFNELKSKQNSSPSAILKFTEVCMKKLELADSVVLPVASQEDRKRRKDVVNSLNELITSAEALLASLEGPDESKK